MRPSALDVDHQITDRFPGESVSAMRVRPDDCGLVAANVGYVSRNVGSEPPTVSSIVGQKIRRSRVCHISISGRYNYGTAILPTRVRRPRDKAKVEAGVLVVERWILARLRHQRFFSLAALNAAIAALVEDLNARPMRKLGVSRRQLFEQLDQAAMSALPAEPFVYAEWRIRRVALDYHVDVDGHYYSVPHRLLREQVEARITARTIELFHKGERVAVHIRGGARGRHTTLPEHMPQAHRRHAEWTIERIGHEAAGIGPATAMLTSLILQSRPHPEQGFRACLGILRLVRSYGRERLEAACARGLEIGARSYGSVQSILQHGLDRRPPTTGGRTGELPLLHPNIRGSDYYH
jgi:transposase